MIRKPSKAEIRRKKHWRLRHHLNGTAERPRLAVFRSDKHFYAQIIDDQAGNTLVSASTVQKEVKSELEKGTVVSFLLSVPVRMSSAASPEKDAGGSGDAKYDGKHVLIAEDNEINMVIAVEQLKSFALTVDTAENGLVATEMFEKSPVGYYDCIFMDIMMPVMDGFAATKKIRSFTRDDSSSVPIIAMTANAFAEDIQKSLENGLNYHLSKPFEREQLAKVLEKALVPEE